MDSIVNQLKKYQVPIGVNKRPPIEQVDKLADELVAEYNNSDYRAWYCGVINTHGITRVIEWRGRAKEGNLPGKLFTHYVNQAGGYKKGRNDVER